MKYKQLSERAWNKKKMELADVYLLIDECQKCGSPVYRGYCCYFCGDSNPSQKENQNDRPRTRRADHPECFIALDVDNKNMIY